jgi:hypothetical protein
MALLLRIPLLAAAFDILNVEKLKFAAVDLPNRRLQLRVFALTLLQQRERDANYFGWLAKYASGNLGINKLLLLRSEFDHRNLPEKAGFQLRSVRI